MPIEGGRPSRNNRPATYVTIGCMVAVIIGVIVVISTANYLIAHNV